MNQDSDSPKPRFGTWACLGCILLLVVVAVGVGGYFHVRQGQLDQVTPTVDEWLDSYSSEDFAATYATLTPELQRKPSRQLFEEIVLMKRVATGAYLSKKVNTFSYREDWAQVRYDATFENGPVSIGFGLKRSEGVWRISHWAMGGPPLRAFNVCKKCGLDTGLAMEWACPKCKAPRVTPRGVTVVPPTEPTPGERPPGE